MNGYLQEENICPGVKCDDKGCKKVVQKCYDQISYRTAPRILSFYIARLAELGTKKTNHVNFPLDNLKMDFGDETVSYDCYAFCNHYENSDDVTNGHYTAYARNGFQGDWFY